MSLLTAIRAAKLWCQQIASISQITFVVSEAARRRKERANNRVQNMSLCIWRKNLKSFSLQKKLNSALVILVQCSVICLPVKLSICNCGEWEEEGGKRERRKPLPDERQSFLFSWQFFFFPPPTRDERQWFGAGSHLVAAAAGGGWAANHWHLTPPKCDGRALTNQTEIWPNFPLYIWQIYCQSLDWFLLLGHKETE